MGNGKWELGIGNWETGMEKGLENLEIYEEAMQIGDQVWDLVDGWGWFARRTVGVQWVRAVDSIAANIAEGYGRYHYKENLRFCYYARGSLQESKTWLRKASRRALIEAANADQLNDDLATLPKRLNAYIGSISKAAD